MKIIVVSTFCLFFMNLSFAQDKINTIQQTINHFSEHKELKNAAISFMAYDVENDTILAAYNRKMAIPPASTVKLFTTATALEVLGKDYQPRTKIYQRGEIDSTGTLHGDLIIRGLGDPSLGSRFFTDKDNVNEFLAEWTRSIRSAGIQKIDGQIIADGSAYGYNGAPDGWSWSDMGNYYGAGPSGCVVYDNMTRLHFSTPYQLKALTQLDSLTPPVPGYQLDNRVISSNSSSDQAYIYGAPYSYRRFATGHLPKGRSNFEVKVSVPDPELLLAQSLRNYLQKDSVFVEKESIGMRSLLMLDSSHINYSGLKLVIDYKGKSIEDIIYWTNHRSVNLFAEQLACIIGYEKTGDGSTEAGVDFINDYWSPRLNMELYQTDGCGLSRSNGFSATHFIQLLNYMYSSENFTTFEKSLPVAGKSGTLRGVCRNQSAQGRLRGKSGTMNRVKSYAGYVNARNGRKIAFALIVNNDNLSNYRLVQQMEMVFNSMARY